MPKHNNTRGHSRSLTKNHKFAIAGVAVVGAAAVAISAVPSNAQTLTTGAPAEAHVAYSTERIQNVKGTVTDQLAAQNVKIEAIAAKKQAAAQVVAKQRAAVATQKLVAAQAVKKAAQARVAKVHAAQERVARAHAAQQTASRSTHRVALKAATKPAAKSYANNLDGWIRESLHIMKSKGIPGSYSGLHRNIMRESSGNPLAINDWDINAINGIPSKGLLQVIPPTFRAYHVPGTSWNIYDPVANITAACNYAADKYGSMDNVNSAY
ncbi:transglycosylase SLT domain-containing protein [Streptomyces olivochromogenes]|uniref:transglycosylase SLT domain-containing protein n=1 Tax=Streptomyces olivochromogenes TaxID=1963 RepID=UPI001F23C499|nr:transglycosylase SLT domain-containing protein [Streptomyces olivochromogenes]MCF3136984.1 transglycosylase SLT domain-containing protein [Streptomyces olivochromogenes]